MEGLTGTLLIEFNRRLHTHGVPKETERRLPLEVEHIKRSAKDDLQVTSWLIYHLLQEHPFVDGNKRTASFVLDYYLSKKGYFLPNTRKLQLILKYTGEEWGPREIYKDLKRELVRYNPSFKP